VCIFLDLKWWDVQLINEFICTRQLNIISGACNNMFLSAVVFIFGVICSSGAAAAREEIRALPPHVLSKFDPVPTDFETAWTAFKVQYFSLHILWRCC